MLPAGSVDQAFEIIDYIIWREFNLNRKLLNKEQLNQLCIIYQQKIFKYLDTYRVIDGVIVGKEISIETITGKRSPGVATGLRAMADALYQKYTNMGYRNLRIDYTNLIN